VLSYRTMFSILSWYW